MNEDLFHKRCVPQILEIAGQGRVPVGNHGADVLAELDVGEGDDSEDDDGKNGAEKDPPV